MLALFSLVPLLLFATAPILLLVALWRRDMPDASVSGSIRFEGATIDFRGGGWFAALIVLLLLAAVLHDLP